VLDYCCGDGTYTIWLAEAGADAYGIDISPVSVQNGLVAANRRGVADRVKFFVMDAEATGFADGFFDIVVISGVLHHLDLDRAYSELARILKPEGVVIATEAIRHNPIIHRYRRRTPNLRSAWEIMHILGRPEVYAARRHFERVRALRWFHLATLLAVPFRSQPFFGALLRILEGVDVVFLRMPGLRWQAWMVVFTMERPERRSSAHATATVSPGSQVELAGQH
jgi:SAM-dependent methyltransferase